MHCQMNIASIYKIVDFENNALREEGAKAPPPPGTLLMLNIIEQTSLVNHKVYQSQHISHNPRPVFLRFV